MKTALGCPVRNAVEATSPGGWVRLSLVAGTRVEVHVEDSGPGPRPEQIPHLFDPFRRASSEGGGLWLGLYIVEQVVKRHGGRIAVTSTAEAGTTFRVTLPRSAIEAPATSKLTNCEVYNPVIVVNPNRSPRGSSRMNSIENRKIE